MNTNYNIELMKKLNLEYSKKPLVTKFATYNINEQIENASKRLEHLNSKLPLTGLKVLEIGCGGGYVTYLLAHKYKCDVVGVDIYRNDNWEIFEREKGIKFLVFDICQENILIGEKFDLVVSFVAWEHIKKPFEALFQTKKLMKEDGKFYLYAWLYRSPMASHLYRHIFFPYPHLLFDPDLVKEYALSLGVEQGWIDSFYNNNKLTYAEYKEYFRILGYNVVDEFLKFRSLDVDFYKRFEDKLGLYPVYDLTLDYFAVILENSSRIVDIEPHGVGNIEISNDGGWVIGNKILVGIKAVEKDLEFAWDIFHNDKKIKFLKWGERKSIEFVPVIEGKYKFKCYIRKKECSKRIVRTSNEIDIL